MAKNFLDPEGLNLYTQALINGGLKVGKAQDSSFANDASTAFYASHADAEGLLGLIPMENIPIDAQNVFIGEYGVTTYDDIIENINNGKIVFIKQESSNMLYTLVNSNSTFCSFANVRTGVGGWPGLTATEIWVNSSSVWDSSFYQLQDYISDLSNIRSNANNALPRSGGQMTGDIDLNGNALLVRKSGDEIRNGIRFTGEGVREGIYVGNPNMRLFLEADQNLDLIHKKGDYFYDILDTNNVATKGNIYPTTWGDTLDNIINAANAGKIVILKRDITYNEQKYSPTYVLNCFVKRVSDDYITECRFYARLEDNVVAEIACKRGPTWVDNGVMQLQENLVSGTNIKTINGNSVLGSGNIDTHEVFIAEYGVTNPQDVFNAIEEGKLVIAKKSDVYYQPEQWLSETSIRFVGFGDLNNFNFFDLNSTTWGTVFSYKWQRADEKVSTITGNIDNIKYPTTQAVVDYAQPIIDSSNKLSADLVDDSSTTHKFVTANEKESWDNKIDKVTSATTGNFANFDSNGGIVDSGKKDSDFATAAQGSLADSAYQKPLDGIPASDIASGVIPDVSQFVTRSVNDLLNYYTKQNTYTKQEVRDLIGSIQHFHYEIYDSLQDITTPATNVLYLIGPSGSGKDRYEEHIYANNSFTKIGDTSIDLSNYVTTQALTSALQQFAQDLQTELNNYALKSQIKTVNENSLIGSGDVSIHPEIVNLTDGEHNSGHYEDLMRTVGKLKLNTPQIFLYTAYNNNRIATTAMCFSTCTNTETPTTNAVIKQTLFLGTYKSIRTLSNTVEGDKYKVLNNGWAQILDIKQSDLDSKVSRAGSSMTGDLNLDYHELQVAGNRNGIKFENDATGVLVGNGNMNATIQSGDADLKHRKSRDSSTVDCSILDTSNVKTLNNQSIYGSGNLTLEDSSNKTNDIANNDADTTKYPSCKGVADYVDNIVAEAGVYDVTAKNNNVKFASLSALLSSEQINTLIPTDVRRGGMSVKFVQSSDNKYVQFRYMGTSTANADFTNTANWQGVDDEPTAGSENLVKSGGVSSAISPIQEEVEGKVWQKSYAVTQGTGINTSYPLSNQLAVQFSEGDIIDIIVEYEGVEVGTSLITIYLMNGSSMISQLNWRNDVKRTYSISASSAATTGVAINIAAGNVKATSTVTIICKKTAIIGNLEDVANKVSTIESALPAKIQGRISNNLFDKDACTRGYYLDPNSGLLVAASNFSVSDFIPVTPGEYISAPYISNAAYFNEFKDYRVSAGSSNPNLVPAYAAYIRVTVSGTGSTFMLNKGQTLLPYEPYGSFLTPEVFDETTMQYIEDNLDIDVDNVDNTGALRRHLDNPFVRTQIKLIGDSITAGQGGTGYSDTGETIGGTGSKANVLTAVCWSNMLYHYIDTTYNKDVHVDMSNENLVKPTIGVSAALANMNIIINDVRILITRLGENNITSGAVFCSFDFYGDHVSFHYHKFSGAGIFDIYIDNELYSTVDAYGTSSNTYTLYSITELANSYHHVELKCTNTKNEASSGKTIIILDFIIPKTAIVKPWGISGTTTDTAYNTSGLYSNDDDFVIIQYGTNDRHIELSPDMVVKNLIRAGELIRDTYGAMPIFMCAPPSAANYEDNDVSNIYRYFHMWDVHDAIYKVGEYFKTPVVDNYTAFQEYAEEHSINTNAILADGLHPNDLGYKVIFMNIMKTLGLARQPFYNEWPQP